MTTSDYPREQPLLVRHHREVCTRHTGRVCFLPEADGGRVSEIRRRPGSQEDVPDGP